MKNLFFLLSILLLIQCSNPTGIRRFENVRHLNLPEQPNILWLVAEDLSPIIPPFGDSTIETPNLSRLANEGICFDNIYSTSGVCSPSRAALATGAFPVTFGANHMRNGPWYRTPTSDENIKNFNKKAPNGITAYEAVPSTGVKMMSEYLRQAGYYCTNNAKEDYQFQKTITAWDESSFNAHWRNRPNKKQPFFSIFNFGQTHESQIWKQKNKPLLVAEDLEVPLLPYLPDTEIAKNDIRRMYSNIKRMDKAVGKILKELEEDGLLEKTIIVWYTDHGGCMPRQKRLLYDSGLKVPMIIRFPNQQYAKTRDNRMISFVDFAPTTLSLVNIEPSKNMHGTAFLGKYQRTEEPKYIYAAADRFDEKYAKVRAVRDERFKYIRHYSNENTPIYLDLAYRKNQPIMLEILRLKDNNQLNETQLLWFNTPKPKEELYDTWTDKHEINNLANNSNYKKELHRLRQANNDFQKRYEDLGMLAETELIKRLQPNGQQPKVATPIVGKVNEKIVISCETEGVTIGYRTKNQKHWTIYAEPIVVNEKIEVIADRIGYVKSEIVEF